MTGNKTIRVAMAQMNVITGNPDQNMARALEWIRQAGQQRCDIIVLPECMDLGWTCPAAKELAQPIPGTYSNLLCHAAREANMYIVAGLTELNRSEIYNTAILISPQGEIINKHRKINELEIAQNLYAIGDSLSVAKTDLGVIGINICADNLPNSLELAHSQARMGAQMILSPSSWAVKSSHDPEAEPYGNLWLDSYRSIAQLYQIPVIGVSNVGKIDGGVWDGRKCIGCSLAVGACGQILAQGSYGIDAEEMLVAECEIKEPAKKGVPLSDHISCKKNSVQSQR